MVVLARDPLQDLRDTNTIHYMMKNGELFEGDTLNEVGPREKPWLHCGGGTISRKSPCLSRVGSRVTALAAGRGNFSEKQREGGTRAPRPGATWRGSWTLDAEHQPGGSIRANLPLERARRPDLSRSESARAPEPVKL